MDDWARDAVFYHAYPLGYCGAPRENDFASSPEPRLDCLARDLGRIAGLGFNALYLGPVFESSAHGYDPASLRAVDRRLGDVATLARLTREAKRLGMRVVFDGVFNHTGRAHPWFVALREGGPSSGAAARYASVRPGRSPFGDGFSYEGWNGCYDLAKLNLLDRDTREELVGSALSWIDDYGIDGIRLDAADCLDPLFISELGSACRRRKADFWLMGEVVGGDYRKWLDARASDGASLLDSITNYECYKGLWSSFVDANLFEIAWSLKRQFGESGIYRGRALYSFADNHDVDRVASVLPREAQLYPLYCLLFAMPGIPSVYYGSERGAKAKKAPGSDWPLRPSIGEALASGSQPDLEGTISRLAALRGRLPALRRGDYRELAVASESLAFERRTEGGERALVAINASAKPASLRLRAEGDRPWWKDELDGGARFEARGGELRLELPPTWARILVPA